MRIVSKLTFIALAAIALGSCQKQVDYAGGPDVQPVLPNPITATLQGNVLDENGAAAAGVTVKVGTQTASTDSRGFFHITGAALDKNQSLVTAVKSGYFKAYRTFAATSGANQVTIKLLKRNITGTVDAATGGAATLTNGSKVELPANGIVDATTGAAYTGAVKVYAAYIDPSAQDLGQVIPGSLLANDKDGRRVVLNSFGMLAVELEGASGQKLQIKTGQNAILTTAIPTAAQASAPATIPMWYVDETTGIWTEQGSATKVGNTYVGNVPHFSFWNCDQPMSGVNLSLTLNGPNNQPLSNTTVRLRRPGTGWWTVSYGITDSLGQVSGMVPANEQLTLEVLDNCYSVVYTQNIGPFTANTALPTITATVSNTALTTVTGTLVNCSSAPVTDGYAIVVLNNYVQYVGVNSNGQFSANILSCNGSGTIQVLGVDNSTAAQSSVVSLPFAAGTTSAGTISACTQSAAEYINYTIDGGSQISLVAGDSLSYYAGQQGATAWTTYINGDNMSTPRHNLSMSFTSPTAASGTYTVSSFSVENQQTGSFQITTVVTNWPATLGGYVEGTFS